MTRTKRTRPLAATLVCGLVTLLPPPTQAAEAERTYERHYEVRYLASDRATAIASDACQPAGATTPCAVGWTGRGILAVTGDAAAHQRVTAALTERDVPPHTQQFQLVLLLGHRQGEGIPADLPEAARQALEDVRSFLPYRRYELLDYSFFRTTQDASVTVNGPAGRTFEARLEFVRRAVWEDLFVRRFRLFEHPGPTFEAPAPPDASPPEAVTPAPPTRVRELITASFGLRRSETVVLGTSKLDGSETALVVLLTALP